MTVALMPLVVTALTQLQFKLIRIVNWQDRLVDAGEMAWNLMIVPESLAV